MQSMSGRSWTAPPLADDRDMPYDLSDPASATFVVMPVLLAAVLVWAVFTTTRQAEPRRALRTATLTAAAAAAWFAATWAVAGQGWLRRWEATPPPLLFLVAAIVALAVLLAWGPIGGRLVALVPLWLLIGVQGFRLPLEIAMHAMYERGIMPGVMTYTGRNFDIVTGAAAIVVAALIRAGVAGRRLAMLWNAVGAALLVNVVTVAILATPRFRYFGEDQQNVWVTYPPYVWLPAVMVLAALSGHLLVYRKARRPSSRRRTSRT